MNVANNCRAHVKEVYFPREVTFAVLRKRSFFARISQRVQFGNADSPQQNKFACFESELYELVFISLHY